MRTETALTHGGCISKHGFLSVAIAAAATVLARGTIFDFAYCQRATGKTRRKDKK